MHTKVTFICRYLSAQNRVLSVRAWIFIRKSMYHIRQQCLGGNARVHTLYGDVDCKIREGTQSGTKIRLKGKGVVSKKNASVHGDQYVEIGIEVPKHLSSQARQKLREYAEAS